MKYFVSAVLASLILLLPLNLFAGSVYDPEYLARWAGCTADVHTHPGISASRSYYSLDHTLFLGTKDDMLQEYRVAIYFHEIGHCLQRQNGWLVGPGYYKDWVEVELDADRFAADLMCAYNMRGQTILHDLFVYFKKKYGYEGDYMHGTLEQRISQGGRAEACRVTPLQSP